MNHMTVTIRVGADGVLHVPLGAADANREVRVTIEPVATPDRSPEEWRAWVESMAGSVTDPTFRRHEQGEFEQREEWA